MRLFVVLRERFARDSEGVDASRAAAVDRDLQEDLGDLLTRQPVAQSALHVDLQLVRTVEPGFGWTRGPVNYCAKHGSDDAGSVATGSRAFRAITVYKGSSGSSNDVEATV